MARKENPGARGGATGAADCHSCKTDSTIIILGGFYSNDSIAFEWAGSTRFAHGRHAWALRQLIRAGAKGCTAQDYPGARLSAYVHKLRTEYALPIETVYEAHGGLFPGVHGRYVLRASAWAGEGMA